MENIDFSYDSSPAALFQAEAAGGKELGPNHWGGIGYILAEDEALEKGIAHALCKVFSNAPRGYLRVYVKHPHDRYTWIGPHIIKSELVELTT